MAACNSCRSDSVSEADALDPVFRRILWIALVVNGAMFVVEMIASQLSNSVALQADALDFFGDAANYAISLLVLGMAIQVRARASLFKGVTMGLFGLFVIGNAGYRGFLGGTPESTIMGAVAMAALIANLGVAALLYRYRAGDSNMQSIWLCSRNDAIGNIAVMAAAGGVFATASRWPDLVVAAIIATLSLTAAFKIVRLALAEMKYPEQTIASSLATAEAIPEPVSSKPKT
jgi:Co/Zn/Cd efflux system component